MRHSDNPVKLFPEFPMTELILGIPLDKLGAPRKQEFILTRNAEVLIGFLHRKREDGTCRDNPGCNARTATAVLPTRSVSPVTPAR